ncbi:MAG: P22 coat protein - protein 5 domain protein [Clostridia bacterium]|nr:P22 coat protein - protein 5 domain protein [Clostridia bacterium]
MAIENFIPTIWSENLYRALDKRYIGVAHCNRDFEGDIKSCGSKVKICGVGNVNVYQYNKDNNLSEPQALTDTCVEMSIDQARYFNFQIDDVDRAQCTPKLMDAAMNVASASLANAADSYIYSLYIDAGHTVENMAPTPENILDTILTARQKLYENNVSEGEEVVLEVSPAIATILIKAKILSATDNTDILDTGCIGSIAGCHVYVTNNLYADTYVEDNLRFCLMRTKRAIAYAEQLSEIEAYRPEKRFADAVKGMLLFGAKVVYPQELVCVSIIETGTAATE